MATDIPHTARAIDLRCCLDAHYDFGFRGRAHDSNSRSSAAIYFHRDELDTIARGLGIDDLPSTRPELQNAIREAVGEESRGGAPLDWQDLRHVVEALDVPVDSGAFFHADAAPAQEADESEGEPSGPGGPWRDFTAEVDPNGDD